MMMARRLHSIEARRYVRFAQLAGVALGVSAAAVVAFEVPGLRYTEPQKPQLPPRQTDQTIARIEPSVDRERMSDAAMRLDTGITRPVAQTQEVPKEPQEPKQAVTSGPSIAYLGAIYESNRTLAVIAVDGRQRIVSEGRTVHEDLRLSSITDDHIVLEGASSKRTVNRGERIGSAVSWVTDMPTAAPLAAANQNQQAGRRVATQGRGQTGGARFSPEMEQRLRERGIDPGDAQRWREAARQRAATQRQEAGGNATAMPGARGQTGVISADESAVREDRRINDEDAEIEFEIITEDGENLSITRLRMQREAGDIGEDDYQELIERLREEGRIGDDGEILP